MRMRKGFAMTNMHEQVLTLMGVKIARKAVGKPHEATNGRVKGRPGCLFLTGQPILPVDARVTQTIDASPSARC